jgi:hypothetical protein
MISEPRAAQLLTDLRELLEGGGYSQSGVTRALGILPQKGQRLAQHDPPGAAQRRARTGNNRTHAQGEAAGPSDAKDKEKAAREVVDGTRYLHFLRRRR